MIKPSSRRVPAEWEPQSAVQLTWPHLDSDWADDIVAAEQVFLRIAVEISKRQMLLIVCAESAISIRITAKIIELGGKPENIHCEIAASNDSWARDHGAIVVYDHGGPRLLDFHFNGWGGKYAADLDNRITNELAKSGVFGLLPVESIDLELEGGALDFDGHGTLLTTTECLLDNRESGPTTTAEYEKVFFELFGVVETHWLTHGLLAGDDTDGHVDTLARFVNPRTIVYQGCSDKTDPQHDGLAKMAGELKAFRNYEGDPYELVALPLPSAIHDKDGNRLPASYANFLLINGAALVPTYADPADAEALHCLQTCFPERDIIGIDCNALIRQFGSLHCVTMQYPEGVVTRTKLA